MEIGRRKRKGVREPSIKFEHVNRCCPKNCYRRLTVEEQHMLFDHFTHRTKVEQDQFLAACMHCSLTKTRLAGANCRQIHVWYYSLNIFTRHVAVCRNVIDSLFHIKEKRRRVIQQKILKGQLFSENRGKHGNQWNKCYASRILPLANAHLRLIPSVQSHYKQARSSRWYFTNPNLTIKKLYLMFQEYYEQKTGEPLDITFKTYFKYFRFKLDRKYGFRRPRVDRCDTCAEFEVQLMADPVNIAVQRRQTDHLNKWEAYKRLKRYFLEPTPVRIAFEFDYAQNLALPKLNNTAQFYRRLLWLYVFNIHRYSAIPKSVLYSYLEGEGAKNSAAVCSMVYAQIAATLADPQFGQIREIILLSDAAGGQNKNLNVSKFLSYVAVQFDIRIEQVFPVRGHSYSQCDCNFGHYAAAVRRQEQITHWKKYLEIFVTCRKNGSTCPFEVVKDVTVLKDISQITRSMIIAPTLRKKTDDFKIQQYFRLAYEDGKIYASKTYNAEYDTFIVQNIPSTLEHTKLAPLPCAPIDGKKISDVKKLLKYVPAQDKDWFGDHFSSPSPSPKAG